MLVAVTKKSSQASFAALVKSYSAIARICRAVIKTLQTLHDAIFRYFYLALYQAASNLDAEEEI